MRAFRASLSLWPLLSYKIDHRLCPTETPPKQEVSQWFILFFHV